MRAIKSSELRIGNWIIDYEAEPNKTIYWQVETIEYLNTTLGIKFRNGSSWTCEEFIEPIKLTEEWLLKFGFELNSDEGDCKFYEKGKHGIRWVDGDEFYFYLIMNYRDEYWILKEIYDVHQLQNLYFSLTGEELTFTKDK